MKATTATTRKLPGPSLPDGAITKAARRAFGQISRDDQMTSAASSAGFVIPSGQKAGRLKGYQVFVKVCRYSDEKLREDKQSGWPIL